MSVSTEILKQNASLASALVTAVVKVKEKEGNQWKEAADLVSVSATGTSFYLPRTCDPGTLLSLMIPLPVPLRCYDYEKDFYRVWGLVQHCEQVTDCEQATDGPTFHIGVAFIGKDCPASYNADPMQNYQISGVGEDGMWRVAELKTTFRKRADVRFWRQIEIYLALIDTKDGATGGERTVTENVSRNGAAVFTTMKVGIGDRVKFISEEYDFSGLAVVCDVKPGDENRIRLHVKFVNDKFPIKVLMESDAAVEKVK